MGILLVRQRDLPEQLQQLRKEDLQKVHTANIFTTLSALDAGFKITENNVMGSNPNTLPEFTIRGKGSFQEGSSAPLFILDGFETTIQKYMTWMSIELKALPF